MNTALPSVSSEAAFGLSSHGAGLIIDGGLSARLLGAIEVRGGAMPQRNQLD